jgi:hypothetical protein
MHRSVALALSGTDDLLPDSRVYRLLETVLARQNVYALLAGRLAMLALRNTSGAFDFVGAAGCACTRDSSSVYEKLRLVWSL